MKKALKTAARGTVFPYAGEKWVVLEHDPAGRTLCLRLDLIPNKPFDENNCNNFATSSSKEWMNGPYLDNLIDAVKGPNAFLQTELDLTADDGLKDYGTCTVTIFSLTVDQYRRNRDVMSIAPAASGTMARWTGTTPTAATTACAPLAIWTPIS